MLTVSSPTPAGPATPREGDAVLSWVEVLQCLSPRQLHLIVLPTEACNFRCVYCYESFRLKRMRPEVVEGVKRLLRRRMPTLDRLALSWFGGEPLLASDIIEDILESVGSLRRAYPSTSIVSDMTTNASLLTPQRLETLTRLGVSDFQVTLDGPRDHHDRKRVRPGGLPTFDLVWGNLIAARESPCAFRFQIRIHVDEENRRALVPFLDVYQSAFGGDSRFELFVRGLSKLGGPNDASLSVLEGPRRKHAIASLRRLAAKRGIRQMDAPSPDAICYAARGNSFVIRADGTVGKCTVALDHPRNRVGKIHPDGTLTLDAGRIAPWMRGVKTADRAALHCPMQGFADVESRRPPSPRSVPLRLLPGGGPA